MKLIGVIENLADISFQEWDHHQGEMLIGVVSGRLRGVSLGSLFRKYAYRGGLMGEGVSTVQLLLPGAVFALLTGAAM